MRRRRASTSAASAGSGPATDLPEAWPTTSRWCAASIRTACSPSTRARRHWRRCCCGRRTSCAPSSSIPTEQKILRATLAATPSAIAYDGDGFVGLKSQLPPSSRRAAVLIDPSYEGNADYGRVVATLREALARFAAGRLHGLVSAGQQARGGAACRKRLEALAPKGWLHARLSVQQPDAQGFGLAGSGMFVINPPHALAAQLAGGAALAGRRARAVRRRPLRPGSARRLKRGPAPAPGLALTGPFFANECREVVAAVSRYLHPCCGLAKLSLPGVTVKDTLVKITS